MKASRLLILSIAFSPAMLLGQKREDLVSIQRDVAQLEDQMKQLQKALDDKTAALTALLQQSTDASSKAAAALQHSLDQKLAEQQTKLVAPVATLSTKIDEMSGDFRSVQENVAVLVRHMNDMDGKIADISSAVRSLAAPPPPPPAAAGTIPGSADGRPADVAVAPPAGLTAELSYNGAYRDYLAKKDDLALDEFAQFLKYFSQTEKGPEATFYMGQIYYRGQQWPDAIKAFDAVLEKFPPNAKTGDADYMKACALLNNNQRSDAGKEFKEFIAKYPDNPHVKEAHAHLRTLGMERPRK